MGCNDQLCMHVFIKLTAANFGTFSATRMWYQQLVLVHINEREWLHTFHLRLKFDCKQQLQAEVTVMVYQAIFSLSIIPGISTTFPYVCE